MGFSFRAWPGPLSALRRLVGPISLVMAVVGFAFVAQAQVQTKGQQKCSAAFDKGLVTVAKALAKDAKKCIKKGVSPQSCVESGAKTAKALDKVPNQVGKKCAETPSFGFTSPFAGMYVRQEGLSMVAEIYGPDLDPVVPNKCATEVAKGAGKLFGLKWKAAARLKKSGLKQGTIQSAQALADEIDFLVPSDKKVQKAAGKLVQKMEKKCGGVTISSAFPGSCSGEVTIAGLAACIDEVVECRFCLGWNRTQGTSIDCDLFDDALANMSCVPDGSKVAAAQAGVTYQCLGFGSDQADQGLPFSHVTDAAASDAGSSQLVLASASVGAPGQSQEAAAPGAGATASEARKPGLQPFDVCTSAAGIQPSTIVTGIDETSPRASGVVDVEFHVRYSPARELDGERAEVVDGAGAEDRSDGARPVQASSGAYVVPGRLTYGPQSRNVVTTTLLTGGDEVGGRRVVAGASEGEAPGSLVYEVRSLDPKVAFRFAPEAPAASP